MYIIKASGKKEEFNPEKISRTLLRAGASKKLASEIVSQIESKVKDGTTTREILDSSLKLLREKNPTIEARYDLKRAIMGLGPTGFPFERFFAEVLKNYGYETKTGQTVQGTIINHEIDVVAEKDSKKYMIECKYHNSLGVYTNIRAALYVYARFLDLKKKFNQPWLATNTKCSSKAISYAEGVGMKITGWQHPKNESLKDLIEKKKLYPVNILKSVNENIKGKFSKANIILAQDLLNQNINDLKKKTGLSDNVLGQLIEEAKKVCG
tara:strand:+ start:43 stop:843 length:801 start_codon:yes stop_codon:yes gene_type:complete